MKQLHTVYKEHKLVSKACLSVKLQRPNCQSYLKPHNHKATNKEITLIEDKYHKVLNFIMHWPNLWHFCMFLGFSSSWRGKQRRYLRYSVGDFVNYVLYFQHSYLTYNLFMCFLRCLKNSDTFKSNYNYRCIALSSVDKFLIFRAESLFVYPSQFFNSDE